MALRNWGWQSPLQKKMEQKFSAPPIFQTHFSKYLTYSFITHIVFSFSIIALNFSKSSTKNYYVVDFVAGLPSGGTAKTVVQKPQEPESIKIKEVNPKEDLLIKSKEKNKKEKEILKEETFVPSPIPAPKIKVYGSASEIPSASAGDGSGVGVGVGEGLGSGSGGAGNFPYTWYVHSIKKKLDANWNVRGGFDKKIYTQVVFTVLKNGLIKGIKVEESSKNDIFDQAALRAVEYSNPFPALPSDFPESELRIHVRFTVKK